jgi:putative ABC transport system substrate-binding protein
VIGFLRAASGNAGPIVAFRRGLNEEGFFEGRNVKISYRSAEGRYDRFPDLAIELVRNQVAVIVALNTPAAVAARAATKSIPIVFSVGADPIEIGLVASLSRPGGNVTGVSILNTEVAGKRLELLHELMPRELLFAYLGNPTNSLSDEKAIQAAAHNLGVRLLGPVYIRNCCPRFSSP